MGCGTDKGGTAPTPSYESLAGTYSGEVAGLSSEIALSATFSLTISQNAGSLSGNWALSGTLSDSVSSDPIATTGTLTGTVASGNNPYVTIGVKQAACPNYPAPFIGAYDSVNRRLAMTGPVQFFGNRKTCDLVLTYHTTIVLNR